MEFTTGYTLVIIGVVVAFLVGAAALLLSLLYNPNSFDNGTFRNSLDVGRSMTVGKDLTVDNNLTVDNGLTVGGSSIFKGVDNTGVSKTTLLNVTGNGVVGSQNNLSLIRSDVRQDAGGFVYSSAGSAEMFRLTNALNVNNTSAGAVWRNDMNLAFENAGIIGLANSTFDFADAEKLRLPLIAAGVNGTSVGQIAYDTATNRLKYWNGSAWVVLANV